MEREIRYCTTEDGVRIAYAMAGEGKPLIAMPVPGFSHVELSWEMFATILPPLAEKFRMLGWCAPGPWLDDLWTEAQQ